MQEEVLRLLIPYLLKFLLGLGVVDVMLALSWMLSDVTDRSIDFKGVSLASDVLIFRVVYSYSGCSMSARWRVVLFLPLLDHRSCDGMRLKA
jgi:hypothetical protein